MDLKNIELAEQKYFKISIGILFCLSILHAIIFKLTISSISLSPIIVSFLLFAVMNTVYGRIWKIVKIGHQDKVEKFYIAFSGLKMLLTLITIFIGVFLFEKEICIAYIITLSVFYLVIRTFDTIYFHRVETKNKN